MKRSLIIIPVVLLVLVVALGFYRGWFVLSNPSPAPGSSNVNVNLTVDPGQVEEDAQTVKDKATELTGQAAPRSP